MSQMMAVQVSSPGGAFEVVKRPVPEPGPNTVRIRSNCDLLDVW
jgi:NADPH:quinone reductase-like Zn-dependent oxidoreductase